MTNLKLSDLRKTWLIDLDGVIFPHNLFLDADKRKHDKLLPGVKTFFNRISKNDYVIITTTRKMEYRNYTQHMLKKNKIRYDLLIMDLPNGERILINDIKPDGLKTAYSVNIKRDKGLSDIKATSRKNPKWNYGRK